MAQRLGAHTALQRPGVVHLSVPAAGSSLLCHLSIREASASALSQSLFSWHSHT